MSDRNPGEIRDPETGKLDGKELWFKVRAGLAVLLSVAVLATGGWFVFSKAQSAWWSYRTAEDYIGTGVAKVQVTIPKGATLAQIASILVDAGVVRSAKAFNKVASDNADAKKIQAGTYNLLTQLPAQTALTMLLDRNNLVRNWMTLKEGLWVSQQIPVMSKASGVSQNDFKTAVKNWKSLGLPSWAKNGLEGFLFPDTYELSDKPTAKSVIGLATKQFGTVADQLDLEARAKSMNFSAYQILTIASIVEKETFKADDRPKVARVIYNRLKLGMPLQLDSTIAYAVQKTGVLQLTSADLAVDSPYNTRLHKGLPPGPISNPGKASIQAALEPANGNWLYFVTTNPQTGDTTFTNDSTVFNAAKQQYLQWCQANAANHKVCYGK